jgi:hypothetical protein
LDWLLLELFIKIRIERYWVNLSVVGFLEDLGETQGLFVSHAFSQRHRVSLLHVTSENS